MLDWLTSHMLEIFGGTSGLLYLYFEYKENAWLWPLGILTSAIYIVVFFQSKFYADAGLYIYYVVISIYGWYAWIKGKGKETEALVIRRITKPLFWKVLGISILLWGGLYFLLDQFTDSPVSLGDAFTSAFSITATWMLTRKILEQWWFWVVINFIAAMLYIYRGLYPTAVLFLVSGVIAIAGYYEWKRKLV